MTRPVYVDTSRGRDRRLVTPIPVAILPVDRDVVSPTVTRRFTSQHGEDRLLAERFGWRRDGFFVEVGALDGVTLSNTAYFERDLGWAGVLVEANPTAAEVCAAHRPNSEVFAVAAVSERQSGREVKFSVVEGFEALSSIRLRNRYRALVREITANGKVLAVTDINVPTATLDQILAKSRCPQRFSFITIDVEGHELDVLRGFSLGSKWRPDVVVLERTTPVPDPRIVARTFRGGYGFVRRVAINDWFEEMPIPRRLWSVAAQYVASSPALVRSLGRELLRRLHVLAYVRKFRDSRNITSTRP